jgi:hypothetical protein
MKGWSQEPESRSQNKNRSGLRLIILASGSWLLNSAFKLLTPVIKIMKSKIVIVLLLLFVLNLEGAVVAMEMNSGLPFNPDGSAVTKQQPRKRRRRNSRRRAKVYGIKVMPGEAGALPPTPAPAPEPVVESAPNTAPAAAPPPPVQSSQEMDAPGRGAPRKRSSAPKIKPPTVQIKPPTR